MRRPSHARPLLQAWLGTTALLLQLLVPAVHPLHGATGAADHQSPACSAPAAAQQVAVHDGRSCVFCAAVAQGRAGAPAVGAAPAVLAASFGAVLPALPHLAAAPSLTRAAPRAPPALA
jgi:hypothetical protein